MSDVLRSYRCFTWDFYNLFKVYVFCNDIGLLVAYFVPLLKGGRFFLVVSTFDIFGTDCSPLPLVAFYI